nr:putative ribonuclease H-like domain-containing protein [Tanacetum cinerariifolium]
MATLTPQDKWSQDKHSELVNTIGNPRARMLTRAMAKQLSATSSHECMFVDFLSEEEPKKSAKKHQSIAMSSTEAEYVAAAGCCANILWMKSQLTNYDIIYKKALNKNQAKGPPFTDHMLAICNAKEPVIFKAPKTSSKDEKKVTQASTPVVAELHKEAQKATGVPTSLRVTNEEGANPQVSSGNNKGPNKRSLDHMFAGTNPTILVDKTKSTRDGLKIAHIETCTNLESNKSKRRAKLMKMFPLELKSATLPLISLALSLTQKDIKLKDLSKLVHDVGSSRISPQPEGELNKKDIGKNAMSLKDTEEEGNDSESDDANLTGSKVESSKKKKLKQFDFNLIANQIKEQKKLKELAKANLAKQEVKLGKEELVDLLEIDVVIKYYKAKLQYEKYYDKLLNRKAQSRITNYDVLTRKGPITLKVYREDGTDEVILNFKASDLHLGKWREVVKACLNRTGKEWSTIYKQIQTRIEYLHKTKEELGIDLDKPLTLGMILFNTFHRQEFLTIEDFGDFPNEMMYNVQEIFFRLFQGLGLNDQARTFSSLILAEVNKKNLNPLKQMRAIKVVDGVLQPVAPITAEERLARKNEFKARGTLLMALPDKHQLKFNSHKDAKTLIEAIKKRVGGNTETKKIHDRLQKLISQLEIHGVSLSQEDVNLNTTKPVSAAASVFAVSTKIPVSPLLHVDSLRRNLRANGPTSLGFDMSKVECYNCHKKRHFGREYRSPKDTRRNGAAEPQRRNVPVETSTSNALVSQCDGVGSYDWSFQAEEESANYDLMAFSSSSLESVEARLLVYKQNESVFEEDIKLLKLEVQLRNNALVNLRQSLEKAKPERDDLKLKFSYNSQVFTRVMFDCDDYLSSGSDESLSPSPIYDRYQISNRYHAVPLPYTRTFMPPKPDLVFNNVPNDVKTDHPAFTVKLGPTKLDQDLSLTTRPLAPIIKDKVSDSEDESETKTPQTVPSFVQSTEQVKSSRPSVQHDETSIPPKIAIPKPQSNGKNRNRKACFVCKSLDHLIKDCDYHEKKMAQPTARNHAHRGNHKHYAPLAHQNPQKPMLPVLTQSNPVPITVVRPISTVVLKTSVTRPKQVKPYVTKYNSPNKRHINRSPSPKSSNSPPRFTAVKAPIVNATQVMQGKWEWKLKCPILDLVSRNTSASMTLKRFDYNDARGRSKSLPDESQMLLRVPRENNMYNVNLKNIVPSGDLTCLFAKAKINESNLWHRRLSHINFKTMNKLVKGNLVRGLPIKVFENVNTCVACKKGKQHKASYKTKPISSVDQPLYRLHMDLFRPTFVKSLNKKSYCLLIIDDYNRFTWVFFLATKDETSSILKTFITGLENQISLKVKVIRSDNGTEFKNHDLNQFCGIKGIKREFSVPRTPQQNGIAKRKNRTLIDAARTMMADLLQPIPFWTEVVNTACYVQNSVLVTKPHNKTPYELLHGRTPSIGFMRPFGCLVTILNTLDSLGKFDGKVDEGFLVGYSNTDGDATFDEKEHEFDEKKPESKVNDSPSSSAQSKKQDDKTKREANGKSPVESFTGYRDLSVEFKDFSDNSINKVNAADITYSDDEDDVGTEADFNNSETSITVSPILTTRVHKDHPVTQIIGDLSSATQIKSMARVAKDQGELSQMFNDDLHTCMFACFLLQKEPRRVHQALKDPSWIEAMQEELL